MKDAFAAAANDNRDYSHRGGTRGRWHRPNFAAFRDAMSPDRILDDGFGLVRIFDEMEKSPAATAALTWARRHQIEFIADHKVEFGGYYQAGTGVVAISRRLLEKESHTQAVGIMTHEIRHAWQDYHGLLYTPAKAEVPTGALMRDLSIQALFEADAEAQATIARLEHDLHGTEARLAEFRSWQEKDPMPEREGLIRVFEKSAELTRAQLADSGQTMWEAVEDWFAPFGSADFYGEYRSGIYAEALGIGQPGIQVTCEYRPPDTMPRASVPDYFSDATLDLLGRSFAGVDYLSDPARRDAVRRLYLSPALAERSFDAAARQVRSNTRAVRRHQTQNRLRDRPQPRRPLP